MRDHAPPPAHPGRILWADLHLLDRQLLDRDGRVVGAVDDVELEFPPDGSAPVLAVLYTGRGALARRLHHRFGTWLESVYARLRPEQPHGPVQIPLSFVHRLGPSIELSVPGRDLGLTLIDDTIATNIVEHIPGARHAPH